MPKLATNSPLPERLNLQQLRLAVENSKLPQWWIAQEAGMSQRTLIRWLGGQVGKPKLESLSRLAQVLGCPLEVLMQKSDEALLGCDLQMRKAALEIIQDLDLHRDIIVGRRWQYLEKICILCFRPDLPPTTLSRLFSLLAYSQRQQGSFSMAVESARSAVRHAELARNSQMLAKATMQLIPSMLNAGFHGDDCLLAVEKYQGSWIELPEVERLQLLDLRADILFAMGKFTSALEIQNSVIAAGRGELPSLLAHMGASFSFMEVGDWEAAQHNFDKVIENAATHQIPHWVNIARLQQCIIQSEQGRTSAAYDQYLQIYPILQSELPFLYKIDHVGAILCRKLGMLDLAHDHLEHIMTNAIFPQSISSRIAYYSESARLAHAEGQAARRARYLFLAGEAYEKRGAPQLARRLQESIA